MHLSFMPKSAKSTRKDQAVIIFMKRRPSHLMMVFIRFTDTLVIKQAVPLHGGHYRSPYLPYLGFADKQFCAELSHCRIFYLTGAASKLLQHPTPAIKDNYSITISSLIRSRVAKPIPLTSSNWSILVKPPS